MRVNSGNVLLSVAKEAALRSFPENLTLIRVRQKVQSVADKPNAVLIRVINYLKRAITRPHQPFRTEGFIEAPN